MDGEADFLAGDAILKCVALGLRNDRERARSWLDTLWTGRMADSGAGGFGWNQIQALGGT